MDGAMGIVAQMLFAVRARVFVFSAITMLVSKHCIILQGPSKCVVSVLTRQVKHKFVILTPS